MNKKLSSYLLNKQSLHLSACFDAGELSLEWKAFLDYMIVSISLKSLRNSFACCYTFRFVFFLLVHYFLSLSLSLHLSRLCFKVCDNPVWFPVIFHFFFVSIACTWKKTLESIDAIIRFFHVSIKICRKQQSKIHWELIFVRSARSWR